MSKYFISLLSLSLVCQLAYADTCPSVTAIKQRTTLGWGIYDADDGTRLPPKREADFRNKVEKFIMAEWPNKNNKQGTIHCYYRDHDGSDLEAYLSKNNFVPQNAYKYWYKVTGFLQCAAEESKCQFKQIKMAVTKLAQK